MKRTFATIAACAALALGTQAVAEERISRSTSVPVASVDFNDSAQVDALYAKLKTSARKMCRGDARFLSSRSDETACRQAALDGAVEKLARDSLAKRHGSKLASR